MLLRNKCLTKDDICLHKELPFAVPIHRLLRHLMLKKRTNQHLFGMRMELEDPKGIAFLIPQPVGAHLCHVLETLLLVILLVQFGKNLFLVGGVILAGGSR